MLMNARFVLLVIAALLFPTSARAAATQEITFSPISNRTTGQSLSFDVAPVASSGLPVEVAASGACRVRGFTVSVLDKGTCSLTATQAGNEEWAAATPITRTFTIARTLLSNKTLTFKTADGTLSVGLKVKWSTPDGVFYSTTVATTNAAGQIKFSKIPGGAINFEFKGRAGLWENPIKFGYWEAFGEQVEAVGPNVSTVTVGPEPDQYPTELRLKVQLANGQPVPGALVVAMGNGYYHDGSFAHQLCYVGYWKLADCIDKTTTNVNGEAIFRVPDEDRDLAAGWRAYAEFLDGDLAQSTTRWGTWLTENPATITFDQLPVVEMETDALTVNYAAAQTISVVALDSDGTPVSGRVLTLSSSSRGATADCVMCDPVSVLAAVAPTPRGLRWQSGLFGTFDKQISASGTSCIGRRVTATTNSAGRATFKVCPVKTATWSVDGRSIVGSAGVRLTVQLTPTAPRTLITTSKTRSVSLTWAAPAKANASAVTDYIVQYRLQGATTWITFRDGTSTARKATVTGLTSGQVYEFRVAAKNKSGTGTWSSTSLGSPN